MSNFLRETKNHISCSGYSPEQIVFIGSEQSGHSCSWDEFQKLADFEYDKGYGAQHIASDLIIVFSDGGILERYEYDGFEGWAGGQPFKMPKELKPIKSLGGDHIMWDTLEEINESVK